MVYVLKEYTLRCFEQPYMVTPQRGHYKYKMPDSKDTCVHFFNSYIPYEMKNWREFKLANSHLTRDWQI